MANTASATLIHTSTLPPTLGSFVTIPNPLCGKVLRKCRTFLDKVHMDIVFGDCVTLWGFVTLSYLLMLPLGIVGYTV